MQQYINGKKILKITQCIYHYGGIIKIQFFRCFYHTEIVSIFSHSVIHPKDQMCLGYPYFGQGAIYALYHKNGSFPLWEYHKKCNSRKAYNSNKRYGFKKNGSGLLIQDQILCIVTLFKFSGTYKSGRGQMIDGFLAKCHLKWTLAE